MPAKIVSYSNTATATPHPATYYLPRLPLIILNELMCTSGPLLWTRDKYHLITTKTQAVYDFTYMRLIHSMLKAAFLDYTHSPFPIGTRKYLWKYSLGYGDTRNCTLNYWILWKNTYSNYARIYNYLARFSSFSSRYTQELRMATKTARNTERSGYQDFTGVEKNSLKNYWQAVYKAAFLLVFP